ncbi:MAG: hypothetical protein GX754_06345 [Clostridiaceae bacterium]|nr:hypothetical protein [Clostridiaceae bacterium]
MQEVLCASASMPRGEVCPDISKNNVFYTRDGVFYLKKVIKKGNKKAKEVHLI